MEYVEYKEKYQIQLDTKQEKAVKTQNGPVLVLSVPGSGKTTTIVAHIGYLVYCCNVHPSKILLLAYNKSAQVDLKSRIAGKFGNQLANLVTIRTVHAFCYQVIREVMGKIELIEEWEKRKILRAKYIEEMDDYPVDQDLKNIEAFIEYVKSSMMSEKKIEEYVENAKEDLSLEYSCYQYYQQEKQKLGKKDFNDLEIITCNLFFKRKDVLEYYQNRYDYICVDEAQDISLIQHKIIDLLARKGNNNLFMVGDEDQSIYGFRAAYPEALLSFSTRWDHATTIMMENNYRSTPAIIQGANRLIRHNPTHQNKKMKANRESDEKIVFQRLGSRNIQYNWLKDYIITESTANPTLSIAVLFRDNDSAIPLIDLLDRAQVQFMLNRRINAGGEQDSIFHSRMMLDLEKFVQLANNLYSEEGCLLFKELCYKFDLHIPKTKIDNTTKYVNGCLRKGQHISILEAFIDQKGMSQRNITILAGLLNLISQIPYLKATDVIIHLFNDLKFNYTSGDEENWKLKRDILYSLANQVESMDELLVRIKELSTIAYQASCQQNNIILSTIHSSKGLEFDHVIVMDMVDPLFPKYSLENTQEEINNIIQEERNLAYVAITRAKSKLTLLEYKNKESKFIDEIRGYKVKKKKNKK